MPFREIPESRLMGKGLAIARRDSGSDIGTYELRLGSVIIQRDGGLAYEVKAFRETSHGTVVNLQCLANPSKVTLSKFDLETKLRNRGSPWRWR